MQQNSPSFLPIPMNLHSLPFLTSAYHPSSSASSSLQQPTAQFPQLEIRFFSSASTPDYSFARKLGDLYMLVTIPWAIYSVLTYYEKNGYEDTKRMLKAKFGWDTPVKQEDFQVKQSIAFGELITVLQKKEKWERELVELLKRKDKLEAELMEILFGKREKKESV